MNKNNAGAVVLCLLIFAMILFYWYGMVPGPNTPQEVFIRSWPGLECTIRGADFEHVAKGAVYVKDGKMRADYEYKANGRTVRMHMIDDAGMTYWWSEDDPRRYKQPTASIKSDWQPLIQQAKCVRRFSLDSGLFRTPPGDPFIEIEG